MRVATALTCVGLFLTAAASASATDGGSGTYTASADTYYFNLFNDGSTPWQYFIVVGSAATRFVGGTTTNEGSAHCFPGQPDGLPNEIECGPVSVSVIPPNGRLGFVATLSTVPTCGAPFQLFSSATSTLPFTRIGDATFAGSCAAQQPKALTPPSLHGVPKVGRALSATAPTWSAAPTSVAYRWQLCSEARCDTIAGTTRLTLHLTKRMAGHSIRIAAFASFGERTVENFSRRVGIRP